MLALERNWIGPLGDESGVDTTLEQFREMERRPTPELRLNWRFQQALYRAYYDAFVRARLRRRPSRKNARCGELRAGEARWGL